MQNGTSFVKYIHSTPVAVIGRFDFPFVGSFFATRMVGRWESFFDYNSEFWQKWFLDSVQYVPLFA
jgi:hypothetical protein